MNLSQLKPPAGQKKAKRRIGRGMGSGRGKTAGRGSKGQRAISGFSLMRGFEGGQMPLHRRLPKRGFTNIFRVTYRTVNVDRLNVLPGGSVVTPESLQAAGLIAKARLGVKVLGNGEIKVALTVRAHKFTASAARKIEAAGGKAEVIAA